MLRRCITVHELPSEASCSVTGPAAYRGNAIPNARSLSTSWANA
jgi:hypothetical protein